ncbi:MAG: glutamine amidotransferase [bacterium]|nr:MAG: glutamine amidotransferase [bacterium]
MNTKETDITIDNNQKDLASDSKRILFIVTSVDHIGPNNSETGYEFSEVAQPYLTFTADGYQVDFASPKGGRPPEDGYNERDSSSVIFRNSTGFKGLNESLRLADVEWNKYDAIFFPGGLGPMADLMDEPLVKKAITEVYESGRVVGAVCHGPVALMNVTMSDESNFLHGKEVAAFTEAEEEGHSKDDVPFMLDAAVSQQGAKHTCANPFEPHVVVDGRLVTGQNPASASGVASAMIDLL